MIYFAFNEFIKSGGCVFIEFIERPFPLAVIDEIDRGNTKYVDIGFVKEIPCDL